MAVSGQCANAHLPSIGRDLLPDEIAFVREQYYTVQAGLAMTGKTLYTPLSIRQYTNMANQHSFMRSWTHLKRVRSDGWSVLEI